MMFFMRAALSLLIMGVITGCSYVPKPAFLHHRDVDYLHAKSIKPLRIPEGVSSDAFHSAYPVSEYGYESQPKRVSILPPGIKS
jgi:uncharacterized lipoprotein